MATSTKTPAKSYPFLVAGIWVSEGRPLEVVSPYDGSPAGVTSWATAEQPSRRFALPFRRLRRRNDCLRMSASAFFARFRIRLRRGGRSLRD